MPSFMNPDDIRSIFASAMSRMYRKEVPLYGDLMDLVRDVNAETLSGNEPLSNQLASTGELGRIDDERHGAIRVGTAGELAGIRRMFAVMGMFPVGYYDLSVAGIPVHSTAFRPTTQSALARNPFRVFTSLLRLDLLEDRALAEQCSKILSGRKIFTDEALALTAQAEAEGGLTEPDARHFVAEALETFRWHSSATIDLDTYVQLHDAHRLIADVVSFRSPHINHLTPRTLDIDAVQKGMPDRGIAPKAVIEGPPTRNAPILLRQTSFKALEETVSFVSDSGAVEGNHTARFGEIEQRGAALKPAGRVLYDQCLAATRAAVRIGAQGENAADYMAALVENFRHFPDTYDEMRRQDLAFFRYRPVAAGPIADRFDSVDSLIVAGHLAADPQTYEDFLPVSAAGIFQSNLGSDAQNTFTQSANQAAFEDALGVKVADEMMLYKETEEESLHQALSHLGQTHLLSAAEHVG